MKYILSYFSFVVLAVLLAQNAIAKHEWLNTFENLMQVQEEKFISSGLALNDYENYDYFRIQNPVYNGIAKGNTKSNIPTAEYASLLLNVWKNDYNYELLEDYNIKLQSIVGI